MFLKQFCHDFNLSLDLESNYAHREEANFSVKQLRIYFRTAADLNKKQNLIFHNLK